MMSKAVHRIGLEFWGTVCEYLMPSRRDVEHLGKFFSEFCITSDGPRHRFLCETDGEEFIASLFDRTSEKRIWHSEDGHDWTLWDRFHSGSRKPRPLPPLTLEPLRRRFGSMHAAALTAPNGGALLFPGPSLSGKSALSVGLFDRGWGFLSDELAVLSRDTPHVHAFRGPVGIRENTLALVPGLLARVRRLKDVFHIRIGESSTYLVRAADLEQHAPPPTAPVRGIVILAQDAAVETPRLERVSRGTLADAILTTVYVRLFPDWVSALPRWRLHYDVNRHYEFAVAAISTKFET